MYQYFDPLQFKQDLEGFLNIINSNEVIGGQCQDFFEFREVCTYYIP